MTAKLWQTKDKEKVLKAARESNTLPRGSMTIWVTGGFSSETTEARKKQRDTFQMLKSCQLQTLYMKKLPVRKKGEIKAFSDEEQL